MDQTSGMPLRARLERFSFFMLGDRGLARTLTQAVAGRHRLPSSRDAVLPPEEMVTVFRDLSHECWWVIQANADDRPPASAHGSSPLLTQWQRLPPLFRQIMLLIHMEHFSLEEAARISGIPNDRFADRLGAARAAFQAAAR